MGSCHGIQAQCQAYHKTIYLPEFPLAAASRQLLAIVLIANYHIIYVNRAGLSGRLIHFQVYDFILDFRPADP